MEEIGQGRRALVAALAFGGAAAVVALVSCMWAWSFAIDDAFIGIRYARHLSQGLGYVWNVGGPSTDGVTPLPWAFMLAPLAHAAPLVVLGRAKMAGALVWTVTAGFFGGAIGRTSSPLWAKVAAIVLMAFNVPLAAHSVSGMETAFATSLVTLAAIQHRKPLLAASLAGLAATLRPELVVWAVVLACGFSRVEPASRRSCVALSGAVAILPFVLCALIRGVVFGRVAPLSVLAKPSDIAHGLNYAGAAMIFSLAPIAMAAPIALYRERGPAAVLAIAGLAHCCVIVAVGGDWMPYARLIVPILPSLLFAFVLVARCATPVVHMARVACALAVAVWFGPRAARALRQAGVDRGEMIAKAGAVLEPSTRIAAVDIGWVSAVSEATIIDLAGVTDPEVATLSGGHTSKHIDPTFLLAHAPDTVVFYTDTMPPTFGAAEETAFPRVVEARLAGSPVFSEHFVPVDLLLLGDRGAGYVVYRRR